MNKANTIKQFEQKQIRTHWDKEQEKWYFSVVDVIEILTDIITKAWSDKTTKEYKILKNLKKENLIWLPSTLRRGVRKVQPTF